MGGVFMAFVTGSAGRLQAESAGVDRRGLAAATRQYTVAQQSAILAAVAATIPGGKMGTLLAKNADLLVTMDGRRRECRMHRLRFGFCPRASEKSPEHD